MKPAGLAALAACAAVAALAWWMLHDRGGPAPGEGDAARAAPAPATPPPQLAGSPRRLGAPPSGPAEADAVAREAAERPAARDIRSWTIRLEVVDASTGAVLPDAGKRTVKRGRAHEEPWTLPLGVDAPQGYVRWEPEDPRFLASRYVTTLAYTHPLRPQMDIEFRVLDPAGGPADRIGAMYEIGGRIVPARFSQGSSGGFRRLDGVPILPGETLRVQFHRPISLGSADDELPPQPESSLPSPQWSARVPFERSFRLEGTVTLAANPPGFIRDAELADHVESDNDRIDHTNLGQPGIHIVYSKVVQARVRARRRDGTPASGALLRVGEYGARADAEGLAEFGDLDPGTYDVRIAEPGLIPLKTSITVKRGAVAEATVSEGIPGSIELHVVDAEGHGLPFARIEVRPPSGLQWLDVEGDEQRIDPYTDHRGVRILHNVEAGDVGIYVGYGSRGAPATVHVVEGATTRAEVVVK